MPTSQSSSFRAFLLFVSSARKNRRKDEIYSRTMSRPIRTRAYTFHSKFQLILAHNFVYLPGDCGIRIAAARWSQPMVSSHRRVRCCQYFVKFTAILKVRYFNYIEFESILSLILNFWTDDAWHDSHYCN